MRITKVKLAVCVAIVTIFVASLWSFDSQSDSYHNRKYGYSIAMPSGWRMARATMLKMNRSSLPQSLANVLFPLTSGADDFVLIKDMGSAHESAVSNDWNQRFSSGVPFDYADLLSGDTVLISPEIYDLGSAARAIDVDAQPIQLSSGVKAVRYTISSQIDSDKKIDVVFIPYLGTAINDSARHVKGIAIRTLHNNAVSDTTFSKLYGSFRYDH